jgi:hypothetical protein
MMLWQKSCADEWLDGLVKRYCKIYPVPGTHTRYPYPDIRVSSGWYSVPISGIGMSSG